MIRETAVTNQELADLRRVCAMNIEKTWVAIDNHQIER